MLRREGTLPEFETDGVEPYQYVFIAGTAAINLVFSGIKGERNEFKLGAPMHAIHARVPVPTQRRMLFEPHCPDQ